MATEYYFRLNSGLTPEEALHLLAGETGLARNDKGNIVHPDTAIWINSIEALPMTREIFEEAFLFEPTLSITFWINKFRPAYDEGMKLMMRCVQFLLDQEKSDAVLLFSNEIVVLQRIQGELLLNQELFKSPNYEQLLPFLKIAYQLRLLKQSLL